MSHLVEVSEKRGVRYLHFGSAWIQGAMRLGSPHALELAYTREMMAGLLMQPDAAWGTAASAGWPQRILMIGLGAASLARFVHRYLPHACCTVVEINPQVVAVARQFFHLPPESARFSIVLDDGTAVVARTDESFDLILVDGFGPDARAGGLDTLAFYGHCRQRLSQQGLLVCNLLGRSKGFAASAERIDAAFAGRSLVFPSCDSGNAIAFAAAGEPLLTPLPLLRERAEALRNDTGLDLRPTLTRLEQSQTLNGGCLRL